MPVYHKPNNHRTLENCCKPHHVINNKQKLVYLRNTFQQITRQPEKRERKKTR